MNKIIFSIIISIILCACDISETENSSIYYFNESRKSAATLSGDFSSIEIKNAVCIDLKYRLVAATVKTDLNGDFYSDIISMDIYLTAFETRVIYIGINNFANILQFYMNEKVYIGL